MTLDPSDLTRAGAISKRMTVQAYALAREWCAACNVSLEDVQGPCREAWVVEARQGLMWLLKHRLGMSSSQIGRVVRRDHSTVLHGIAAEDRRRTQSETPEP